MKNIEMLNEKIMQDFKKINRGEDFSNPLLISPNCVNNKIMYIGQEPNLWANNLRNKDVNFDELQSFYFKFLRNNINYEKDFWKFIKLILGSNDIENEIVWANIFLAGDKNKIGLPKNYSEIEKISIDYLTEVYSIIKPERIISVCGAGNPYYRLFSSFLNNIGQNIKEFPTASEPIKISEDEKCFWTYHPNFLDEQKIMLESSQKIKKMIKK